MEDGTLCLGEDITGGWTYGVPESAQSLRLALRTVLSITSGFIYPTALGSGAAMEGGTLCLGEDITGGWTYGVPESAQSLRLALRTVLSITSGFIYPTALPVSLLSPPSVSGAQTLRKLDACGLTLTMNSTCPGG
ncbi:hypothetical protein R1sor_005964 [Riccia sorocarpa]|uniref:Uncharacterized protein n=1 Tax=Riccia sorocarpa TaxID=122646 RepID=A0ABD3HL22_9MARC